MKTDKVIIIAEAGVNHNGNYDLALKMVDEAKRAGADYVKFQTAKPELVISTFAPKAEYQKETTGEGESQLEMCKAIHLPLTDYRPLRIPEHTVRLGFNRRARTPRHGLLQDSFRGNHQPAIFAQNSVERQESDSVHRNVRDAGNRGGFASA